MIADGIWLSVEAKTQRQEDEYTDFEKRLNKVFEPNEKTTALDMIVLLAEQERFALANYDMSKPDEVGQEFGKDGKEKEKSLDAAVLIHKNLLYKSIASGFVKATQFYVRHSTFIRFGIQSVAHWIEVLIRSYSKDETRPIAAFFAVVRYYNIREEVVMDFFRTPYFKLFPPKLVATIVDRLQGMFLLSRMSVPTDSELMVPLRKDDGDDDDDDIPLADRAKRSRVVKNEDDVPLAQRPAQNPQPGKPAPAPAAQTARQLLAQKYKFDDTKIATVPHGKPTTKVSVGDYFYRKKEYFKPGNKPQEFFDNAPVMDVIRPWLVVLRDLRDPTRPYFIKYDDEYRWTSLKLQKDGTLVQIGDMNFRPIWRHNGSKPASEIAVAPDEDNDDDLGYY